jgi:L-threonylcarbamoyladenylate synthase
MQKGLILVAADITQLDPYVDYPSSSIKDRVQQSWPGPTTWVLPAAQAVPPWIKGSHANVAVRVSAHPLVQYLCKMVGVLVSTSANPSHCPPAKTAFRVMNYFGDSLDYILHGKVSTQARPTVIKDAFTDTVLRA